MGCFVCLYPLPSFYSLHVIMLLWLLLAAAASAYPCSELLPLSNEARLVKIRQDPPDLNEAYSLPSCIDSLLDQGLWEAGLLVASKAVEAEITLSEDLRHKVSQAKIEVDKLFHG